MKPFISAITTRILNGGEITADEALRLATVNGTDRYALFLAASTIKEHFVGSKVSLCSIINANSSENNAHFFDDQNNNYLVTFLNHILLPTL